jgi:hypothetical protein
MVTNNGDVFGGTAIGFGDVLGDHQFLVYADTSVQYASQSRTFLFNWSNRSRRLQYALEARMQTQFYFAAGTSTYLSPIVSPFLSTSEDTRGSLTERGGSIFAIYPIDRYRRAEMFGGFFHFSQHYSQTAQEIAQGAGVPISSTFRSGFATPMGVSFVQETTVFRDFGPLAGNTIRANLMIEPPIASLSSQTIDVDARFYQRLATSGVLALRVRGFKSAGSNPRQFWFGGNGEMRGYDYLQFVGNNAMFANAELRFPIIDAALTPIGVVGALRGVFFANIGGAFFSGNSFDFFETGSEQYRPIVGAGIDPGTGLVQPIYGLPRTIDGLRLKDGRASYGVGLQTFLLGFPLHIDWSWRTLFSREWEDALFAAYGGSHEFRKVRFGVWVGYDF